MTNSIIKTLRNFQNKDIIWTDRNLLKTPFHTQFWVHKRIREAIAVHAQKAHGTLLDVGCGVKPYEPVFAPFVEKYIGLEYSPESGYRGNRADVACDAAYLPFANASFDTILCTEVMEHVVHPEKVIEEFARILKPNGVIITTAPFIYPIHGEFDFFRYTSKGLAEMMKRQGLSIEKAEPLSGSGLTLAILFNIYVFDLGFLWKKWLYPFGILLRPLLWLLIFIINMCGWLAEKIISSDHLAFNHITVARADQKKISALKTQ